MVPRTSNRFNRQTVHLHNHVLKIQTLCMYIYIYIKSQIVISFDSLNECVRFIILINEKNIKYMYKFV